jgi:hypothetical protein
LVCIVSRGELDERYTEAAGSAQMTKDNIVVTIELTHVHGARNLPHNVMTLSP